MSFVKTKLKNNQSDQKSVALGFTLIELLVVISIISVIAAVVIVQLNNSRSKTRDTQRRQILSQMAKALELYFDQYNQYPVQPSYVSSAQGEPVAYSANYVPGLAPNFIDKLPQDPLGGLSSYAPCAAGAWKRAILYQSNGTNYKLLMHCSPESSWNSSDPYYDPVRPGHAWQISTPAVRSTW